MYGEARMLQSQLDLEGSDVFAGEYLDALLPFK